MYNLSTNTSSNISALLPELGPIGSLPWDDALVGVVTALLSFLAIITYVPTIFAIAKDKELMDHCCYQLMVHLGVSDIFQLTMHFIGGIMSLSQSVWSSTFNGFVGGAGTAMWFAYNMFTNLLAFNRFVEMGFPQWSKILFGPLGTKVCVALGYIYGIPWFVGYMTGPVFIYRLEAYAWHYNSTNTVASFISPLNATQNAVCLIMIVIWYLALLFKLKVLKSNMSSANQASATQMEKRALLTCGLVCGMLFFPSTIWHFWPYFLPPSKWTFFALNMLWMLNSAMNPVIYFTINKTIQKRVKALFSKNDGLNTTEMTNKRSTRAATKARIRGNTVAPVKSIKSEGAGKNQEEEMWATGRNEK